MQQLIVKETDQTINSSDTLQDDNELLFAVGANEVWQFEGMLFVSTGTTPDFKLTFTGPSGAVGAFGGEISGASSYSAMFSLALGTASGSLPGFAAGNFVRVFGAIHNGATAGNLTLQWAQFVSDAGDTKVLAGSYLKYEMVGAGSGDPTTGQIADAVLDEVVEGSYTLRQLVRLMAAALLGELSGAATTTIVIRDASDTKVRITATVDEDGNRTAITLDAT